MLIGVWDEGHFKARQSPAKGIIYNSVSKSNHIIDINNEFVIESIISDKRQTDIQVFIE